MIPVEFKEQNSVLMPPPGVPLDECLPLPVYRNGRVCVSCWELSDEEMMELIKTKRVYLLLESGQSQPPCMLSVNFTT